MYQNRVLRRIFGSEKSGISNRKKRNFRNCTLHPILGQNQGGWYEETYNHMGEMGNAHKMLEKFLGRYHSGDAGMDGKAVIKVN